MKAVEISYVKSISSKFILLFSSFLFIVSIIIKISADLEYYETLIYPSWTILRHVTFLISLVLIMLVFFLSKKKEIYGEKQMIYLLVFLATIFFISLIYSAMTGKFSTNTISQLYFIGSSFIYVFFLTNIMSEKEIDRFIGVTFLACIYLYINFKGEELSNFDNFLQIDFLNSYSPFEASAFSGYFYGFMVYFTLKKKNIMWSFASIVMVFLTFKRINVVLSLIFLFFGLFVSESKRAPKVVRHLMIIIFIILPIASYYAMQPNMITRIASTLGFNDTTGLLMGRDNFFNILMSSNFESYGLGSMDETLQNMTGHGFELDGLRIYLELGFFGVLAFSLTFWNLTKDYLTNIFIMFVFFLNYLTSAQLTDNYALLLMLLTISLINKNETEKIKPEV